MEHKSLDGVVNEMIKKYRKVMVTGDYHIPFEDKKAYSIMKQYAKDYKPDIFVINGDLIDFYTISRFDSNPERKISFKKELELGRKCLTEIRDILPNADIYYLEGNHENRLQHFIWRNPELDGLEELALTNLLQLEENDIKFVGVDRDYWRKDTGHLIIGKTIIMHGDSRLNGASYSKYSGYSAKNTLMNLQSNIVINHTHRLGQIYHSTPYSDLIGIEGGSLCQKTGTANWQQGFVTFEVYRSKMVNPKLHKIDNGILYEDGSRYRQKKKGKRNFKK